MFSSFIPLLRYAVVSRFNFFAFVSGIVLCRFLDALCNVTSPPRFYITVESTRSWRGVEIVGAGVSHQCFGPRLEDEGRITGSLTEPPYSFTTSHAHGVREPDRGGQAGVLCIVGRVRRLILLRTSEFSKCNVTVGTLHRVRNSRMPYSLLETGTGIIIGHPV